MQLLPTQSTAWKISLKTRDDEAQLFTKCMNL